MFPFLHYFHYTGCRWNPPFSLSDCQKGKENYPWAHSTERYHKSTGYHGACATRCRHSFIIKKGGTATKTGSAEKGPFLWFYFPHASLMYRHESNDFFVYLLCIYFFTDFHPSSINAPLWFPHILFRTFLHIYDCFFFLTKQSYI